MNLEKQTTHHEKKNVLLRTKVIVAAGLLAVGLAGANEATRHTEEVPPTPLAEVGILGHAPTYKASLRETFEANGIDTESLNFTHEAQKLASSIENDDISMRYQILENSDGSYSYQEVDIEGNVISQPEK